MSSRLLTCLFAATALLSVGCDDATGIGDDEAANVRVVHASITGATATPAIDVDANGQVSTGNTAIGFGGSSECVRVNADDPDLTIQSNTTGADLATPGPFDAGGRNMVILTGPAATLRVTTIGDPVLPVLQPGRARVRIFNGRTTGVPMDVTVTPFNQPAAAVTQEDVAQATASGWLEIPAGAASIRLRNQNTTTPDLATLNIGATSGQEVTWIVVDPETTGGALRWVFTTSCAPADD